MAGDQLRFTEGTGRGKALTVEPVLLIGRAAAVHDGRLGGDPELSRRHARVARDPDGALTIEDLGSANGTFVNGERIDAPRTLELGDVVRVGRTALAVTDASGRVPEPTRLGGEARADEPAGVAEGAAAQLLVTDGSARGRRLTLGDEFVIGRTERGEGRLGDDPELSRRHARVSRAANGRFTIEDLGSANGTFVNDVRVRERQALKAGDVVRVGATTLKLTEPGQPAARAAPARPRLAPEAPAARERVADDDLRPGSVVAGCRVDEVIGRGDMGVVYRAEELALQRRVALKLIVPEYSQEERFRERFRRESMLAASIDHPNVIPILEAGDEDGVLFITMRLVEGTDLRALIVAEGRIDPLRAARIVRQVGAGLDAAHKRGLVHRDVKPANVLLARGDHVYLSDFGLAKLATSVDGLTRQGSILARAEYAAPEQITDDRVDARTDIYALGCLLFEALTGEAPFAGWKGEGPAMLAHLDAPRPSPRERCPDLPGEFDDVVRRAMAIEPSERYPSAGDLGEAALAAAARAPGGRRAPAPSGAPGPSTPGVPASRAHDEPVDRPRDRSDALRWGIALAALAIVAVGMVAALGAISTL